MLPPKFEAREYVIYFPNARRGIREALLAKRELMARAKGE